MLNVQNYLRTSGNSLETLHNEFGIIVNEYPDIVVLNYNQIDSPRFHPICDECRALILEKGSWDVVARSFQRFYNLGEGHDEGHGVIRGTSFTDDHPIIPFDLTNAVAVEKLDGTLITAYWYKDQWNFSTRKMAYAEGLTNFGMSFADLIKSADNYKNVEKMLDSLKSDIDIRAEALCWIFELTSPANRIVTPYNETKLNLLASVHRETGIEMTPSVIKDIADIYGIGVPNFIQAESWDNLIDIVESMPSMEEGCVAILDDAHDTLRIKIKNSKFVAIAHMRENGGLSPKSVLKLVITNEYHEYLDYFPEDEKYFTFVAGIFDLFVIEIADIYHKCKDIEDQKEFALTIQKQVTNKAQCGFLFRMRKGEDLGKMVRNIEPKKFTQVFNLKEKFAEKFCNVVDDDD